MKKFIFVLPVLFLSAFCFAGPPYTTDDPDTIAFGSLETYVFYQMVNNTPVVTGALPELEANYGLMDWMQLHLIAPLSFYADNRGIRNYGPGDIELGIKAKFIGETDFTPMAGIFPHVEAPTGDNQRGLGSGKWRAFLPVWFQKSWVNFMTYGGGGYWIEQEDNRQNWVYLGWVLRYRISPGIIAGLEINYNTAGTKGGAPMNSANVGLDIDLSENSRLMFSYGQSITGDETYMAYAGYRMSFGAKNGNF